jgi:predicted patatin/cPLA2 family phospholipase
VSADAVRAVLNARRIAGSTAPHDDGHRVVLVIEGGGSRAAFSSGMVLAIDDLGLAGCFDAVYGSSAGSLNGAWLLCGRAGSGVKGWTDPTVMRRGINPRRALSGKPVFDLEYLVGTVYTEVVPMDFPAILANPTAFHPLAADADTGAAADLAEYIVDVESLQAALRATSCLPLLAGEPVELGGRRFLDAGIVESVPYRTALASGATHLVVLRSRQAGELLRPDGRTTRLVMGRWFDRNAPAARAAYEQRPARAAADEVALAELGNTLQIRPPADAPRVSRASTDTDLLARAVRIGRSTALAALVSED